MFNNYFNSVPSLITSELKKADNGEIPPLSSETETLVVESIFMDPVTECDVLNYIQLLKNKTSAGYDNLSSKLLKQISEGIVQPLTFLINRSLEEGTFPDSLKVAKAVPFFRMAKDRL